MSDVPKRLTTIKKTMERLCCSQSHVYVLLAEGKITAFRTGEGLGYRTLVNDDSVDAYLAALRPLVLRTKRDDQKSKAERKAAAT